MTIAVVSGAHVIASGLNTFTSGSIDTSGSNFLVAAVIDYTLSSPAVLTDSKGNTWVGLTSYSNVNDPRIKIYYAVNPTVGSGHTFTLTGSVIAATVCVQGFSGVKLTSPFDSGKDVGNFGVTTSIQAGSLTPSENDAVVVAAIAYQDTTAMSINGGFTITDQGVYVGGDHFGGGLAYLIQTTAAAANPTWSWTNSVATSVALSVFKVEPTSGSVRTPRRMLSGVGA